ncbi:eukaryotic translation initiation factor 4 gamma 2-like protein [Dinothrombium tinctorium]|uniref:Eukaryotic translation initiation factor 4 gamma 2-like protein n=1 Tax=Dinothrombium tinctorium TaxID=1965070 RepID=A0A3S3NP79_9ACAR|nr:eukaryotic translation initiation factor 4 gamma 2-like protein [Dinothrombium tinctorium]
MAQAIEENYYDLLDVLPNATGDEVLEQFKQRNTVKIVIRKAYRHKALLFHPDKNKNPQATEQFQQLKRAVEVLGDERKRQEYDMKTANEYCYDESEFKQCNRRRKKKTQQQQYYANVQRQSTETDSRQKVNDAVTLEKAKSFFDDFLSNKANLAKTVANMKQLKISKQSECTLLTHIVKKTIKEEKQSKREEVNTLLPQLRVNNVISSEAFRETFSNFFLSMGKSESAGSDFKSIFSSIIVSAINDEIISLRDAFNLVKGRSYYIWFFFFLQRLFNLRGKKWLIEKFSQSNIKLIYLMPESERNDQQLLRLLNHRGLEFLYYQPKKSREYNFMLKCGTILDKVI